jgi:hypothetical protein
MATFTFSESQYRFIDPIRYFKSNDPYYWEVDNIPLKQLQENCLWLKDQLQKVSGGGGSTTGPGTLGSVKRSDLDELKPFANGGDRVVRVRPGRYTARINDIGKNPLASISRILGEEVNETNLYKIFGANASTETASQTLANTLNKFKSILAADAMNMNGLTERAFTWAVRDSFKPSDYGGLATDLLKYSFPTYAGNVSEIAPFLYSQAILPRVMASPNGTSYSYNINDFDTFNEQNSFGATVGFSKLPLLESLFVKRWRGVARTSIVDVPTELSVTVPIFNAEDFYYVDENGNKVQQTALARIDLIFIYSKPVDASGVSVFKNGSVNTLTEPALGIVRGAGIGPVFKGVVGEQLTTTDGAGNVNFNNMLAALDSNGNPRIQSHIADSYQTGTTGFLSSSGTEQSLSVRGSFPSPDDIMNISPLLCNELEENAVELIGQTILPVAYVYVPAVATPAVDVVDTTDIIDIRPLFRTTELTYNERAGIAAAVPQLSLANPAVGKAELDRELYRVSSYLDQVVEDIVIPTSTFKPPYVAAVGYVFGGYQYGPEAALFREYCVTQGLNVNTGTGNDTANAKLQFETTYGYADANDTGNRITIPDLPDWEIAYWCNNNNTSIIGGDLGNKPYDRLNILLSTKPNGNPASTGTVITGSKTSLYNAATPYDWIDDGLNQGTWASQVVYFGGTEDINGTFNNIANVYVRKTITFNRPSDLKDYYVEVDFINCSPLICGTNAGLTTDKQTIVAQLPSKPFVTKEYNKFHIYVPLPMAKSFNNEIIFATNNPLTPWASGREGGFGRYESVVVMSPRLEAINTVVTNGVQGTAINGSMPRFGVCVYPTVTWKLFAIKKNTLPLYNGTDANGIVNLY